MLCFAKKGAGTEKDSGQKRGASLWRVGQDGVLHEEPRQAVIAEGGIGGSTSSRRGGSCSAAGRRLLGADAACTPQRRPVLRSQFPKASWRPAPPDPIRPPAPRPRHRRRAVVAATSQNWVAAATTAATQFQRPCPNRHGLASAPICGLWTVISRRECERHVPAAAHPSQIAAHAGPLPQLRPFRKVSWRLAPPQPVRPPPPRPRSGRPSLLAAISQKLGCRSHYGCSLVSAPVPSS